MLALALAVAFPLYDVGAPLPVAAFLGAIFGVIGTWFVVHFSWRIWKSVERPFSIGDPVVVMSGPQTGAVGKVKELGKAGDVLLELQTKSSAVAFRCHDIQKL